MNIIKIQDQLKGVSDDVLVGYVQNPTGNVPTYLALSELQRRKDMRSKYQASQPESTTVAEELVQEAQPQPEMEGIAGLPEAQPMMQAMAPPPEMPVEQMAQGGLAELDVGDMYDENNYAEGGIVAFAKGGIADDLGVIMPEVPTYDDLKMEELNAFEQYGVDPEFYKKQAAELQRQKDELKEDKSDAGWMALANLGFGAAAAQPQFGKAQNTLSIYGASALNASKQLGADLKDIRAQERLLKQADMKLAEAKQAEARGDARNALKLMDDRKNLLLNAQLKEADIRKDMNIANAKLAVGVGKSAQEDKKLEQAKRTAAAKLGEQMFLDTYPSGSASTVLGDDPGFIQFVRNLYTDNAYNFIDTKVLPPIPSEDQMRKMYDSYKTKKGATTNTTTPKTTKPKSSVDIKRPSIVDKIFKKHPDVSGSSSLIMNSANAAPNKRFITTNTEEELNTPWDRAGEGLDDEYYQ